MWGLCLKRKFRKIKKGDLIMATKGNPGRGGRGGCGGTRRRDGSGRGIGNKGTKRQPPKKK